MEAHEGRIWALESAQDETALVTGGQDGSIAVSSIWYNVIFFQLSAYDFPATAVLA